MKFRRKSTDLTDATTDAEGAVGASEADSTEAAAAEPVRIGPYDVAEVPAELADLERVDLGSLLVAGTPDRELRLQVDEATGAVQAALIASEDGGLELRAFAAPRNGDLWGEVRPQLAADVERRGGAWGEREGRWGTELMCQLPVTLPDGESATQVSRIIGINGPRWMLRATLLGRPAVDGEVAPGWEECIARVVVRRGDGAMPVGEALPLSLPPQAKRVE